MEHFHSSVVGDHRNDRRGKVLLRGEGRKSVCVLSRDNYRHTLLRFGNSKLGSRQPLVLFGHFVKPDFKPVGKLAYGDRNAARAEVVTLFNHTRRFAVQKQSLKLALGERVALLNFRAAGLNRLDVVSLGGARRAAAAVSPGFAAQKYNQIALLRFCAVYHIRFRTADHEARFKPFCPVTGVIDFLYLPRGKPYLVAVRREARRRGFGNYPLRKLALYRVFNGIGRVCATRNAHGLKHIRSARKRIAYRAAETSSRAAERFYFGRVVVRFVLEHYRVFLFFTVEHGVDFNRAGVYLV